MAKKRFPLPSFIEKVQTELFNGCSKSQSVGKGILTTSSISYESRKALSEVKPSGYSEQITQKKIFKRLEEL